jgi:hypothetical protein
MSADNDSHSLVRANLLPRTDRILTFCTSELILRAEPLAILSHRLAEPYPLYSFFCVWRRLA